MKQYKMLKTIELEKEYKWAHYIFSILLYMF